MKLATPVTTGTLELPPSVLPPGLFEIATVTFPEKPVSTVFVVYSTVAVSPNPLPVATVPSGSAVTTSFVSRVATPIAPPYRVPPPLVKGRFRSVNRTLPSGPAAMAYGKAALVVDVAVIAPVRGTSVPILLATCSVNQILPSPPAAIPSSSVEGDSPLEYSVIEPSLGLRAPMTSEILAPFLSAVK
jgi:hypothetical protein